MSDVTWYTVSMFKMRISTSAAALYRRAIIIGINKAREEFRLESYLAPAPFVKQSTSDVVKSLEIEGRAYRAEKRKHGWVSAPRKTDSDSQGEMNPALQAALAVF